MNLLLMIAGTLAAVIAVASGGAVSILSDTVNIPGYSYDYAVSDHHSNDKKAQWETRYGDVVKGSYSLVEPDGSLRVVDYTADDLSGFNAVVKKIGPSIHPLPHAANTVAPLTTILGPVKYGFGATPVLVNLPKMTSHRQWSLPWDPFTHSYGGWVPITGNPLLKKFYLTILTKQYDHHGNLHKWISSPMPLNGRKVVVKRH